MAKKDYKIVWLVIIILIALYVMNSYDVFDRKGLRLFEIVPIDCPIGVLCHETYSPYECPSGVYRCNVKGIMECLTEQPSQPKVYFRTNSVSSSNYNDEGIWIALDCIPSGDSCLKTTNLNGYCRTSTISSGREDFFLTTPHGNRIYVYNSLIYIETAGTFRKYESCTDAELSITPTEPYKSNGQELTSGAVNLYYCVSTLTVKGKDGSTKDSEQLKWDSTVSGMKESVKEYLLEPGWTIELTGSGSRHYLVYSNLEQVESCDGKTQKCKADGTGYYDCIDNVVDFNNFTLCEAGEVCDGYFCTLPFSYKEASLAKTGYTLYEDIILKTKFISTTLTSGDVIIKTFKFGDSEPTYSKIIENYDFRTTSQQPIYTSLVNPNEQGQYYVTVDLEYNGEIVPIIKSGEIQFRIAPEVSCNINLRSEDRSELLVNVPIIIELNTYQGGFGSDMDLIDFSGTTFNGKAFSIDGSSCTGGVSGNAYIYTCNIITSEKGDLVIKAEVTKSQVKGNCNALKRVNEPRITVGWVDTSFLCAQPGTKRFQFVSKDPFGNYIDTDNTLLVTEPATTRPVDRSSLIQRTDVGKYEFDYPLAEPLGGIGSAISYKFEVTGYSDVYKISSTPIAGILEVRVDCKPQECLTNQDCIDKYGSNWLCYQGNCKEGGRPDWLLYALIFGGIIAGIFVVFLIIHFAKNKKASGGLEL